MHPLFGLDRPEKVSLGTTLMQGRLAPSYHFCKISLIFLHGLMPICPIFLLLWLILLEPLEGVQAYDRRFARLCLNCALKCEKSA